MVESAPPAGVTLRRAVPDDAAALTDLHLDCWDDAYRGLMPGHVLDARRTALPERVASWREVLGSAAPVWLAEHEEGLIGFAGAAPDREGELELRVLYVRGGWWGRGVGHHLFVRAVGERPAHLWVLAGNERALAFYRRQGFVPDGRAEVHEEGPHVHLVRR